MQKPLGKHIGTVNGYHIHDLGANTPHKDKRFLAYHNEYAFISHTAPTKTEIAKKSKEYKKSGPTPKRTEHDDWRDSMKHRVQSGEIRRAVMSKRLGEEVAVNSVGAGNVAGLGVGPQGEPGVKKKKKNIMTFSRFAIK